MRALPVQFARFVTVGVGNTTVSWVVFLTAGGVRTPPPLAAGIAFAVGAANGFVWNSRWTFAGSRVGRRTALKYATVQGAGLMVSVAATWLLASELGRIPAYAIATALVTFTTFTANRLWTYSETSNPAHSQLTGAPGYVGHMPPTPHATVGRPRRLALVGAGLITGLNVAVAVVLWARGGNVLHVNTTGDALVSVARITGLLGAQSALAQVLLLARIPWLERAVGFDRLTVWHRWNGFACLSLVVLHTAFSLAGYAALDRLPVLTEISTMIWGDVYPGMVTATIGTALFVGVAASSIAIARRKLSYELWYAVHLMAYAAIALAWFHQIPTGNELVIDRVAAGYWRSLYVVCALVLVCFRLVIPMVHASRYRLRVAEVVDNGSTVSIVMTGRRLDQLGARAGQFFLWRFLARGLWWQSHPFSLSAAPNGRSLRITMKKLGDFTGGAARIEPGTRVVAEGPFGTFTERERQREKVLLVGGGIGIAPIRALLEEMRGDVVVVYRAAHEDDLALADEIEALAEERGATVHHVVGDHRTPAGRMLLSHESLSGLVPDIAHREVYICGPPAMADAVRKVALAARVPGRNVHVERFAL